MAMAPVEFDEWNPCHSLRRAGLYLRIRRFKSDMSLAEPPLNGEGQKIMQLCRCPYAQLVCYQCINTYGDKAADYLGDYVWF